MAARKTDTKKADTATPDPTPVMPDPAPADQTTGMGSGIDPAEAAKWAEYSRRRMLFSQRKLVFEALRAVKPRAGDRLQLDLKKGEELLAWLNAGADDLDTEIRCTALEMAKEVSRGTGPKGLDEMMVHIYDFLVRPIEGQQE